jgi:hypothetical protein
VETAEESEEIITLGATKYPILRNILLAADFNSSSSLVKNLVRISRDFSIAKREGVLSCPYRIFFLFVV